MKKNYNLVFVVFFILVVNYTFSLSKNSQKQEFNTQNNYAVKENHQITSSFKTTANTRPEITVNLTDGDKERFAKIYYINGTTRGHDPGYDGKLFEGTTHYFAIYTELVESDGERYQIQSLPNNEHEKMVIPIGIIASAGKEITFTVEALNLPNGIKVYLEDRENNIVTRLDEANTNYIVSINDALDGTGRFYLHTRSSTLKTDNNILNEVTIYTMNQNTLRIKGINSVDASIKIYTIQGKKMVDYTFTSKEVTDIDLPSLKTGVYIVQLATEKGKKIKKIMLE